MAVEAQPAFQVKDLNTTRPNGILPEPASDYFPDSAPAAVGGTVFFAASDGIHGFELWKSDGTDAGTRMVMDICPGSCASVPRSFKALGGVVIFVANDGLRGSELWKSDGTPAGTVLIKELFPGDQSDWIDIRAVIDGQLIFSIQQQFWQTDGTAEGTVQFQGPPERLNPRVVVAGGREFFVRVTPDGKAELWTSDGTEPGTVLVKVIQEQGGSFIGELTALGANVLFIGPGDGYSYSLWKSDGTANGTGSISSIPLSSRSLTTASNRLLFFAGCTLWTSNGTGVGTGVLKNFRPDLGPYDNCPQLYPMPSSGDQILFFAYDGIQGPALWKSNGTLAGTSLIQLLNPNVSSSYASPPSVFADGRWYFRANGDEETGEQLWTSDGTAAGTRMLRINYQQSGFVVNTRGDLLGPRALFDWNGTLLFQGGLSE
ncbi:MAG TPA: ELWxxDGT repeat protein, partial [Thermoanaerobaculia bacterium]|nr:ELWxxDGT repeat protein [Thermoanaerobaculia bacterium]